MGNFSCIGCLDQEYSGGRGERIGFEQNRRIQTNSTKLLKGLVEELCQASIEHCLVGGFGDAMTFIFEDQQFVRD